MSSESGRVASHAIEYGEEARRRSESNKTKREKNKEPRKKKQASNYPARE